MLNTHDEYLKLEYQLKEHLKNIADLNLRPNQVDFQHFLDKLSEINKVRSEQRKARRLGRRLACRGS